jgi:4-diphosphocytidyl-2-C-methyl-D-erythritol kinase
MRAARALRQALDERRGARLALRKEIPVAAGLGGGRSDAASTLLGLTRLWDRTVPRAEMERIAAGLGSDVPFFLTGGTALGEGRGERVSPLPPLPERWLVLLTPPAEIAGKTGRLYGALSRAAFTDGAATRRLVAALRAGEPVTTAHLVNAFERVAGQVYPEYERWRRALLEAGAPAVHLAGSGPSLFSLVSDRAEGEAMARRLAGRGAAVRVVKTVAKPYNQD